jgi:hypothetical protein
MSSENVVHDEVYKGYKINIVSDDDADNPRGWDNAGKMVCWHNRYELGDIQPKEDAADWLRYQLSDEYNSDWLDVADLWELMKTFERKNLVLTLYLYDHSGISISTGSFIGRAQHAEWDSGRVGFIYISKEDAVKEWGKKNYTKNLEKRALKYLQGEVETYDDYLRGNVYGYEVCEYDAEFEEDGDIIDSCYGFYPDHDDRSGYKYCLDEAKSIVDWEVKEAEQKKWESAETVEQQIVSE